MFVPKNIEKRQEDFKVLKAKEAHKLAELCQRLNKNLEDLRHNFMQFIDENERLFFYKLTNCQVKIGQETHYKLFDEVFFIEKNSQKYIASYNVKEHELYISFQEVWSTLEFKGLNFHQIRDLMAVWTKKLKIEPLTISTRTYVDLSGQQVMIETRC